MAVYKRAGSKFYHYDFLHNGVRYKASTKRSRKADAEAVEAKFRSGLLDQQQLGRLPSVTLREAVASWYADYGHRLKDAPRIAGHIGIMFDGSGGRMIEYQDRLGRKSGRGRLSTGKRKWTWPGDRLLHQLTNGDLATFVNMRLREGVSAATIYQEASVIKRTLSRLKSHYMVPNLSWPTPREDKRLVPNKKSRHLSETEVELFLEELNPLRHIGRWVNDARSHLLDLQMEDAFDLAIVILDTGVRPDEAMSLMWQDIILENRRIHVDRSKVLKWTGLSMSSRLFELFTRRLADAENVALTNKVPVNPYVFPDRATGKARRRCVAIGRAMNRAGLNEDWKVQRYGGTAVMYSLRDTFASRLLQSGKVTLKELSVLLGHSSVKQTEKYAHLLPDAAAENAAAVLDILNERKYA